jgi:hypothetical protein
MYNKKMDTIERTNKRVYSWLSDMGLIISRMASSSSVVSDLCLLPSLRDMLIASLPQFLCSLRYNDDDCIAAFHKALFWALFLSCSRCVPWSNHVVPKVSGRLFICSVSRSRCLSLGRLVRILPLRVLLCGSSVAKGRLWKYRFMTLYAMLCWDVIS